MSTPAGWQIDADGWCFRQSRAGDPQIGNRVDLGFDDSTYSSRSKEGKVYVRSAEIARSIDAGRLPQ